MKQLYERHQYGIMRRNRLCHSRLHPVLIIERRFVFLAGHLYPFFLVLGYWKKNVTGFMLLLSWVSLVGFSSLSSGGYLPIDAVAGFAWLLASRALV